MSIYDILRRPNDPDSRPAALPAPDGQSSRARTSSAEPSTGWRGVSGMPIPNVPMRWAIEVQRIALLLTTRPESGEEPWSITFSSLRRKSGTTTISYMVAHYLATERAHKNVLFVGLSDGTSSDASALTVGQDVPVPPAASDRLLNRMSVRPGRDRSPAVTSMWFRELMTEAHKVYDFVIVDSPPFATAPETYSLAKTSNGVVLVLRCGEVRYSAVNALVADVEQLGIPMLGVVLNHRQYPIPTWLLKIL